MGTSHRILYPPPHHPTSVPIGGPTGNTSTGTPSPTTQLVDNLPLLSTLGLPSDHQDTLSAARPSAMIDCPMDPIIGPSHPLADGLVIRRDGGEEAEGVEGVQHVNLLTGLCTSADGTTFQAHSIEFHYSTPDRSTGHPFRGGSD